MSNLLSRLLADPAPSHAFEISQAGIAFAHGGQVDFHPIEPDVLAVTPSKDNLARPEVFANHVSGLAVQAGKRRPATLILPDFAARVQVLDFDAFPTNEEEQISLIKFRVRKTVPFDIDSSIVSYHSQQSGKRFDVVAAVIALEIVARYEAPFRSIGFQPGLVTTSSLAALNLASTSGVTVVVKLSGNILCVMVQNGARLQLARTVELENVNLEEVLAVLHPTIAYIEDELKTRPDRVLLVTRPEISTQLSQELNLPVETATTKFGAPTEFNAGLLGYLQGATQ